MARSDLSIRIGADLSGLNSQLGGALKGLKRFGFKAESIGRDLTTRISLPLIALGGVAVKTFAEFDRLEKGLAALSGSAQGGADAFSRLNKIVLDTRTTLDLKTAALGEQRLVGAGLAAAEAERTIKQLGIAATVSGSSIDDVGGVLRQFTQIVGKGKVEQEDLNSILDRMPALGALITAEFGGSTAEAIRDTGISMEDFVSRLTTAIEQNESFQNVQGGLAKSFESFANAVQVGIRPLGEAISKSLNLEKNLQRLGDFVGRASQAFADLNPNVQKFIIFTGLAAAAVGPLTFGLGAAAKSLPLLISGFKLLGGPLSAVTGGFKVFSGLAGILIPGGGIARVVSFSAALSKLSSAFAVLTGPIGLTIAAIAIIGIAITKAYKNSEFFRNQIGRLGEAFSSLFSLVVSIFPSLEDSFGSVGDVFNFVFSVIAATISATIESFLTIIDTIKAVVGAISSLVKGDLSGALDSAKEAFDLTLGGGAGKRVANAFGTTFSQTLKGELKKITASKEVEDFARKTFGLSVAPELPQGIRAPGDPIKKKPTKPPGPDPTTRGTPDAIQELNNAAATLSDKGAKKISEFFNEFVIGSLIVDGFQSSLSGLEIKPIKGLDRVARIQEVFEELGKELTDGLGEAFLEVNKKAAFFGKGFDPLREKIDLTNEALARAYDEGLPATGEAVLALKKNLAALTDQQNTQAEAQEASNASLSATRAFYESLGLTFNTVFENLDKGQKAMAAGAALVSGVLSSVFSDMANGAISFGAALAKATRSIVGSFIKQGVAAVVASALTKASFLGPLVVPVAAAAGASANAMFQGLLSALNIPALADGGITTGAQLALIGEAGPEAVVPLPTLDALIRKAGGGGNSGSFGGNVEFVIRGEDLVGVISRAESSYKRSF
jgi:tape measure domain-containing protein